MMANDGIRENEPLQKRPMQATRRDSILKRPNETHVSLKSSKKKRESLLFRPSTEVFEFDSLSPPKRRLEQRFLTNAEDLDTDALKIELEAYKRCDSAILTPSLPTNSSLPKRSLRARKNCSKHNGVSAKSAVPLESSCTNYGRQVVSAKGVISTAHSELAQAVEKLWTKDLLQELNHFGANKFNSVCKGVDLLLASLEFTGLKGYGTRAQIAGQVQLAYFIQRRATLKFADFSRPLHDLSAQELIKELEMRKIDISCCSRNELINKLETALLKEQSALKVEGYTFGKRFVSVEEYLQPLTDAQLRCLLKEENVPIPRRKQDKFELLQHLLRQQLTTRREKLFAETLRYEMGKMSLDINSQAPLTDSFIHFYKALERKHGASLNLFLANSS